MFSRDRAAQLDALLTSVRDHAGWLWPPVVLYASSDEEFAAGYRRLAQLQRLHPVPDTPLKQKLLESIDPKVPLTTFLVDDAIFYRPFPEVTSVDAGTAFAPRLGKNCTYCYPLDRTQREGELDFLYFFSVDGHVYRTEEILPRMQAAEFSTPNQLEDALSHSDPLKVLYNEHSCLVGIPHNRVGEYDNRHAGGSPRELNARFLKGERIDPASMDFSHVIGAHQEIEYVWKPEKKV